MRGWRASAVLAIALVVVPLGVAVGQEAEAPKALVVTAENLMAGDARHQDYEARGGDPAALLPGDVVRYRLQFTNLTSDSVRQVVFQNPVPVGLEFVAESAGADRDDVSVEYSIDGGATYAATPMAETVVAGQRVLRPAPPETYTHIRWTLSGWLQPQAAVTAEYRARLPGDRGDQQDTSPGADTAEDIGT
jgi:uncharacterized repeat protein (TIGR01451 family)